MKLRMLLLGAALVVVGGGSADARTFLCGCSSGAEIPDDLMPAWSPDGKRIAFIRSFHGNYDLYVMSADGSHQRALTHDEAREANPDWSPDGSRIVFQTGFGDARGINVIGADGKGLTLLDGDDEPSEPAWSPDGKRIVYVAHENDDEHAQIAVMNADGTDRHVLLHDAEYDVSPAWSPDGSRIAFEGGLEDSFIDVMNSDGTGRARLTFSGSEYSPAWVPDGRITYERSDGDDDETTLIIMNADGSGAHELLGGNGADDWASDWSPDGRRFAFVSNRDDTRQIYVADAEGTHVRRLTGVRRAFTSNHDRCTIVGTNERDYLRGTGGDDVICGLGGADEIDGGGGNDIIDGGAGADALLGGPGYDVLLGAAGDDLLDSRDGKRDDVDGGPGSDRGRIDPGDWIRLLEHIL